MTIPMQVAVSRAEIPVNVNSDPVIGLQIGAVIKAVDADVYEGATEFTPTAETQTIRIKDRLARADITINPIPSNYGLITWNGAFLTVS